MNEGRADQRVSCEGWCWVETVCGHAARSKGMEQVVVVVVVRSKALQCRVSRAERESK